MKTLLARLRKRLMDLAYPSFDCEDCVGMRDHGCYCSANGASAPGAGPTRWHLFLRWILRI